MADDEAEIRKLVDEWNRTLVEKDVAAAERLRDADYTAEVPGQPALTGQQELDLIGSTSLVMRSASVNRFTVRLNGDQAAVEYENLVDGDYMGSPMSGVYRHRLVLRKTAEGWRATRSTFEDGFSDAPPTDHTVPAAKRAARRLPPRVRHWLRRKAKALRPDRAPTFQELAYIPYKPRKDYVLPPRSRDAAGGELPIPPRELWLGYNYPAHGKAHVAAMMEIVEASGFSPAAGDRILDLGCGAGRMIRHLQHLASKCEIWGTDISAEHIFWCRRNLSPPFRFATTTKVPHLPFEDRSFGFIYCGSLFTHIDDLADAWLLELHRILRPDGRLYVTVHDKHTMRLFEDSIHSKAAIVREIRSSPTFQGAKDLFGMFTVGRDDQSQVFYDDDYLRDMFGQSFEILSVNQEAYFYQTAYLLKRKAPAGETQ